MERTNDKHAEIIIIRKMLRVSSKLLRVFWFCLFYFIRIVVDFCSFFVFVFVFVLFCFCFLLCLFFVFRVFFFFFFFFLFLFLRFSSSARPSQDDNESPEGIHGFDYAIKKKSHSIIISVCFLGLFFSRFVLVRSGSVLWLLGASFWPCWWPDSRDVGWHTNWHAEAKQQF